MKKTIMINSWTAQREYSLDRSLALKMAWMQYRLDKLEDKNFLLSVVDRFTSDQMQEYGRQCHEIGSLKREIRMMIPGKREKEQHQQDLAKAEYALQEEAKLERWMDQMSVYMAYTREKFERQGLI